MVGFYVRRVSTRKIMMIADQGKLLPPKVIQLLVDVILLKFVSFHLGDFL